MKARYLTIILLLFFVSVVVRLASYDANNSSEQGLQAIGRIPMQMGQWQGKDMPLEKNIYEILETRAIIHRTYSSASGENVFLSIVYYTETKVDFHAPESCLGGQGLRVNKEVTTITVHNEDKDVPIRLNQLLRKEEGPDTLIWYFYKAGNFLGEDYVRLRLNLAFNKFTRKAKSGSLIRLSVPMSTAQHGEEQASDTLRNFTEDLYPFLLQL